MSDNDPTSTTNDAALAGYQADLGRQLRQIRQQKGLTLQQVEDASDGEWKAVVVGSYERGDRSVSVAKLARLADFYEVPLSALLPTQGASSVPAPSTGVVVDLQRLAAIGDEDDQLAGMLIRLANGVQSRRGDYNGRILSLRNADLESLAHMADVTLGDLVGQLRDRGLILDGA
jgi:transcriptional regulator with XRE-family HTH domain